MSDFYEHVYDKGGLTYVTRWARRPNYDIYDLFILQYDLRDGRRAAAYWKDDTFHPTNEGMVIPPAFSITGQAATCLTSGKTVNFIEDLTNLLKEALPE